MKLWNTLKVTFYYGICMAIVNGKIFPFKQTMFPLHRVYDGVAAENYDTLSIANPNKSDFVRHHKTVVSNGVTANDRNNIHTSGNALKSIKNQPNGKNLKAADWHDNGFFKNGKQLVLKGDESIDSNQISSPISRLQSVLKRRRSVDFSLSQNGPRLRRQRRGFRSSVADRIAHGFGKRAQILNLDDSDLRRLRRLRNTLGQLRNSRAQEVLSLQPEDKEDIEPVMVLYDNALAKLQKSKEENEALDEDRDKLVGIYEALLKKVLATKFQDSFKTKLMSVGDSGEEFE